MKERFMKNGVFSLEYDKETLKDMVLKLQEENTQLTKENTGLKEQVAYLRRSCERKEETIYEQYDELVGLDTRIDKAIEKLNSFIECCKAEKLESGSDYLHHQYWNMFQNFNRQIKDILKEKI